MAFQTLVVTPTGDIFQDLYNKFDNNANQSIDSMTLLVNTLTLTRSGGGTLTVNLPIAPNRIVTGMVSSSVGFNLSITAGTYQINNASFSIGAGAFVIPAAHPTLNRIDILVADDLNNYVYLTGTAAVNPVPPAVASNQVLVTAINVPAASVPNLGNGFYLLPQGTLNGQTLRWNAGTMEWITSDVIINTDAVVNVTPSSNFNVAAGTFPNNSYINSNAGQNKFGIQLGASAFSEINFDSSGISIVSNGVGSQAVVFDVEQGIQINSYTPSIVTDKLYQISGVLYWSGDAICLAPCGGGGLPVGTVDFSTLRYDLGATDWVENTYNLANENKWNQTCCSVTAPSFGVANNATGLLFSQGAGITINGRASVIMACGANTVINHIPTLPADGLNTIISSNTSDIDLHPDYKGLCTLLGSNLISISSPTLPITTDGQAFSIASYNSILSQEITRTGIIGSDDITTFNTNNSGAIFSSAIILGTSGGNMTNYSGLIYSQNSNVTSAHAITKRCVVIGGDAATIESGQTCGIFSSVGSQIKAYTGVGAIQCINSAILGGNTNIIDPTGTANIQQCVIIGGVSNNLTGGAGNATNSAIISSTSSDITPAGAGNRIVLIGVDSVSGTRNATTYIDSLKTEGARIKKVHNLGASTYTVLDDDHIIDCQSVGLYTPVTVTLPLTPEDGREVIITNSDGSCGLGTTVNINGNGKNVNGVATQAINNSPYFYKVLIFVSVTNQWIMS